MSVVGPSASVEARPSGFWRGLAVFDRALDVASIALLVATIVIVFTQVITRKLLSFVFIWSEEVTLLCLTWFAFVGIAIGFREKVHLAMDMLTEHFSKRVNKAIDRFNDLVIFAFGLYLAYFGWLFTVRMNESTLPATGLPNSLQYVVVPITGLLCCLYSTLQFFGVDTRRYLHIDEEIKREDAQPLAALGPDRQEGGSDV